MARSIKAQQPITTAQQLGSLIKSARTIMRKDKGLSTDLDRLPMLTWIMFLKFLDDMEHLEEERAELAGDAYRPAIEPPYRWRDWAAPSAGITGDELTAFVSYEDCLRPDGTRGPGLLPYLRGLRGVNGDGAKRRNVIGAVFKDVQNRMMSGYLLRDVVNKVNGIHFLAREELFTLGHMYETMLREMRDAAGDSGEFYTPRPVVRFMVAVTDPKLGEQVLDPACGTGGFLAEAYQHLEMQSQTVEDRRTLQERSLYGGEAKPLPYLLCQMNLLLHGLEAPQVDSGNSLRFKLSELGDKDRVDVILTNPPFGGEEEPGIRSNFPSDTQTSETALLFLQLIMRKLRRGSGETNPGRAAVVVPDGILSSDGVAARIREQLLTEFDLHTVVRLPGGVFAPYTGVPTNILFFERTGPTESIWFYEQPMAPDKKAYSKTSPFLFEEFAPCLDWWRDRTDTENAWQVRVSDVRDHAFNLDIRNPALGQETSSVELRDEMNRGKASSAESLDKVESALRGSFWKVIEDGGSAEWRTVRLGDVLNEVADTIDVLPDEHYRLLGVRLDGNGPYLREEKLGQEISAKTLNRVTAGLFIYSRLFAWRGAFGVVPANMDGCHVSGEFPTYELESDWLLLDYLRLYFTRPLVWRAVEQKCQGTTKASRNRFKKPFLLAMEVSAPDPDVQRAVIEAATATLGAAAKLARVSEQLQELPQVALASLYRGSL